MQKYILKALPLVLVLAGPAIAEPTIGLGVTFTYGGGAQSDVGLGLRLFSNNERKKFVASVGVDYMLKSQSIRPNIGAAYLASNSYVGMDIGFDLGGGMNVGVGLGAANTKKRTTLAPAVVIDPVQ
ncbi:MAG: hypothetical protein ACK4MS_04940 [Paracoccaceae bacterium]